MTQINASHFNLSEANGGKNGTFRKLFAIANVVLVTLVVLGSATAVLPRSQRLLTFRVLALIAVMMGALLLFLWHWHRPADRSRTVF
jgi:uncharacterized membrane-anchored protein